MPYQPAGTGRAPVLRNTTPTESCARGLPRRPAAPHGQARGPARRTESSRRAPL